MTPPRRSDIPRYHYFEAELTKAAEEWGCNCGPGSLAMMLCLKPNDVRHAIPVFAERGYTNSTMMKQALAILGVPFTDDRSVDTHALPAYGLCRIQWGGPWVIGEAGRVGRWGARFSHWIGAMKTEGGHFIFDVNGGWMTPDDWTSKLVPIITALYPKADGQWYITNRLELQMPLFEQAPTILPGESPVASIDSPRMRGVCRGCGCTEEDCRQCIEKTGAPCHWIDDTQTICSRCASEFLNDLPGQK